MKHDDVVNKWKSAYQDADKPLEHFGVRSRMFGKLGAYDDAQQPPSVEDLGWADSFEAGGP